MNSAETEPNVLIVEDDLAFRSALVEFLAEGEFRIETPGDGAEAISKISRHDFAAILLDIGLPNVSGYEVIEWLRRESPQLLERVIVVSAVSPDTIRAVAPELKERLFLKPVDPLDLLRCVEGHVALHS